MKYIASCSFGKDSLAAIILWIELGYSIDKAMYCKIMFDDTTSAELPEHEYWIHETAIPLLKNRYGVETVVVQADQTYVGQFFTKYQKGKKVGEIYGFPYRCGAWCNARLKVRPLNTYIKSIGECRQIIGIAADEHKRKTTEIALKSVLPLDGYDITEQMAYEMCARRGFLSPAYNSGRFRLGCWFCHNQKISEFRRLRADLWSKLMALDSHSPHNYASRFTVHE